MVGGIGSRVAAQTITAQLESKADGLLAPLLEEEDESSTSSDESSQYSSSTASSISVKVKQTAFQKIKTALAFVTITAGAGFSVVAMIVSPAIAVFVMGGIAVAHAPFSAYKESRIIRLPALRSLNNKLREDANKLQEEVDVLAEEIDLLQPEAVRAAVVEEELREIAAEQHVNVDKIVNLVKENDEIINQMKDNLRQRIVQDVLKIVMMSDKNNDGRFCKVETKMLVLKISLQLQEYGVEFDEAKFYKVMSVDPSVARTLTIVKRLIPSLNEEDEESGEDYSDEGDEDADAFDMFHMIDDTSRQNSGVGSIGSASGRRLSLSISKQPSTARRRTTQLTSPSRHASSLGSVLEDSPQESPAKGEPPVFEDVPPVQDMTSPRIRKRDIIKGKKDQIKGVLTGKRSLGSPHLEKK